MRNRPYGRALAFIFLCLGTFSCSFRSPVSQVKDRARVSTGDGAAAALRMSSSQETGQRSETRSQASAAEAGQVSTGPQVGYAVRFGYSVEARSLPPATSSGEVGEINELNDEIDRRIAVGSAFKNQDATIRPDTGGRPIHAFATSALPSSTSFEGLADTDNGAGLVNPSDSNGAVGPNHYVEVVNSRVRVYDKAGSPLTPPFRQSSLFASVGGICSLVDRGDPIVLYDKLADRWQVSQFSFANSSVPPFHQCIAESINGDPAGAYYLYDFLVPGTDFPDYPKLSTWPDAYYLSTRQFSTVTGFFRGEGVGAFDRKKILVGDPTATLIFLTTGSLSRSSSGMLPSDFDGVALPPPGAPNIFAIYTAAIFGDPQGNALRLFDFHVDFDTPANSTFLERPESPIAVAAFDPLNPSGRADIEQPPPSTAADRLDTIGDRLMHRLQYRNRDGVESLVSVHTVNVGVHLTTRFPTAAEHQAAPRYYELRRSGPGAFSLYDQATFAPDAPTPPNLPTGLNRWMGSAAIDNQGNLAVGYSTSSASAGEYPSVAFAARAFNETGGLLQGEAKIFQGLGSQQASGNRWGDYSSLALDPVDECTFFYVNEYYPTGLTQFNWHTRVGKFKFDGCTPPSRGKITGKVTDCVTGLPIVGAVVQVSDGRSGATGADGTYSIPLPPGSYAVAASDPFRNCNPAASQNVDVSDGGTATADFCLTGNSKINLGAVTIDDSLGNNNHIVNRDECVKVNLGVSNDGCIADSNISGTLSTSTPGVTINQAFSAFPNLAVNTSGNNATPYAFTTAPSFVCGTPIQFTLTVSSDHQATHDLHFSLPTCAGGPSMTVTGSLGPGDSLQDGRMGRDGNPSGCAIPKGCPGVFASSVGTNRFFDSYPFTNPSAAAACFTVDLTPNCVGAPSDGQIFSEAYLNSYIPTPGSQECTNYLGDLGGSPVNGATGSYSFNVPAGGNFVVVVNTVTSATSTCSSYTAKISGFTDDTPGHPPIKISSLWPANHALINVGLGLAPSATCPETRQVTVYSDEDDVDPQTIGDMSPDAKDLGLGTLRLRAERSDSGDGRVYLVVVRRSDGTGTAFSCQTVAVAHSQSTADQNSVAAQAAAAQTFCTNNGGAAPAGYFLVGDGPVIGPKQ